MRRLLASLIVIGSFGTAAMPAQAHLDLPLDAQFAQSAQLGWLEAQQTVSNRCATPAGICVLTLSFAIGTPCACGSSGGVIIPMPA